jgi:hypothetical protein
VHARTTQLSQTDFELGELAGSLRNILLVTKHEFDCIDFKTQVVNEDGTRTFKLTLVFDHNSYMEIITGTTTAHTIDGPLLSLARSCSVGNGR